VLSVRALSPNRHSVLLKSTDRSSSRTNLSSMLSPLCSVLTNKLQFSVQHECCVCAVSSSSLYLTCVEAVPSQAGYNLQKLRLSARYLSSSSSSSSSSSTVIVFVIVVVVSRIIQYD